MNMQSNSIEKQDSFQGSVSVVVPLYNEEENVAPLVERLHNSLRNVCYRWEIVLVDDGSRDQTLNNAHQMAKQYGHHVRIVALQRNFGQTAAMQAGIDHARGELIVTMDGDLQNDPDDIPKMIEHLEKNQFVMLSGWRQKRQDKLIMRKIPSWIANRLIGRVTGVKLHDYGCSLKVYRASILKQVTLFGEMHRFIPAWVATVVPPTKIGELVVNHNPRTMGKSKYGISRSFRVILDLLAAVFFMRYKARPGHFFGSIGFVFGTLGTLILGYLGVEKFIYGEDIGTRPLLLVGVICVVAAMQFITTGVLSEMMARIYFESSGKKSYVVREIADENDTNTNTVDSWWKSEQTNLVK